jgi:hypothetical protein
MFGETMTESFKTEQKQSNNSSESSNRSHGGEVRIVCKILSLKPRTPTKLAILRR